MMVRVLTVKNNIMSNEIYDFIQNVDNYHF